MFFNNSVVSGIRAVVGNAALSIAMLIVVIFAVDSEYVVTDETRKPTLKLWLILVHSLQFICQQAFEYFNKDTKNVLVSTIYGL